MSNVLNGYRYPVVKVFNGTTLVDMIDLPQPDIDGLMETIEMQKIEHELFDYSAVQENKGFYIVFEISYKQYINKTNLQNIIKIVNYALQNYSFKLYPRADCMARVFDVNLTNAEFLIGLLRGGNAGHKGLELVFKTNTLQTILESYNPEDTYVVFDQWENLVIK